eukprot:1347148-Karenia_brevis.AAC.1
MVLTDHNCLAVPITVIQDVSGLDVLILGIPGGAISDGDLGIMAMGDGSVVNVLPAKEGTWATENEEVLEMISV